MRSQAMTAAPLPSYPQPPKAPPAPERRLADVVSTSRAHGFLLRLLFVLGIWGGLFALRSALLSREPDPQEKEIVGTWEMTDDSDTRLELTGFGRFTIFSGQTMRLTGKYDYHDDGTITTTTIRKWNGHTDEEWEGPWWTFKAKLDGDDLTILGLTRTDGAIALRSAPGASVQFKRKH
jgi:hypothetical protein